MDDPSPRPLSAQGPLAVSSTNPRYFSVGPNDREAIYLTGSHVWNNLHDGMGPGGGCADARGGGLQYTSSASATLSFSGDHIAWIGSKGSDYGSRQGLPRWRSQVDDQLQFLEDTTAAGAPQIPLAVGREPHDSGREPGNIRPSEDRCRRVRDLLVTVAAKTLGLGRERPEGFHTSGPPPCDQFRTK